MRCPAKNIFLDLVYSIIDIQGDAYVSEHPFSAIWGQRWPGMKVWRHWPTYDDQHIQKLDLNVDF